MVLVLAYLGEWRKFVYKMQDFEKKVKTFLSRLSDSIDADDVVLTPETKLEQIEWDSLAAISAISIIDELFDVVISVEGLSRCETIGEILKLIKE